MMYKHFNKVMRMELSILRRKGYSFRSIATELKINISSVSRELKRNCSKTGEYSPDKADHSAYRRRKYSKCEVMKIRKIPWLEVYLREKLKLGWTPEQISGRLKQENGKPIISFKLIYAWVYSVYGQTYAKYLPSKRKKVKKRKTNKIKKVLIPNRIFITERPEIIEKRKRLGDFEGDTLGKKKGTTQVLTGLVDRKSRYFFGRKVARLRFTMQKGFQTILPKKSHSLTLDNGVENQHYSQLNVPTYFCHPYSSWEKGTIENTFQRLRRFIPKKSDLANYSHQRIAYIVDCMNNTPRKCLGFRTPAEVFKEHPL